MAASTAVWLFDLDNTLHDASHAVFSPTNHAMTDYIVEHVGLPWHEAHALRQHYWHHYGATLLGLIRHHGVNPSHFLEQTHRLPGLEQRLRMSAHDRIAVKRLPGRKVIVTNAPRTYALRVLKTLRLLGLFDELIAIEDMTAFGHWRPKPDPRMLRCIAARLKVPLHRCVLVEDTLINLKAAYALGMRTVWMQRYVRVRHTAAGPPVAASASSGPPWGQVILGSGPATDLRDVTVKNAAQHALDRRPAYVHARVSALRDLGRSLWCFS
jgi:putative hydrolase of the HAD superfamily